MLTRPLVAAALVALTASVTSVVPAASADAPHERRVITAALSIPASGGGEVDPSFGPAQRAQAIAAAQRQADRTAGELGLSARERLHVTDVVRDADGQTHVRYVRTYAGLAVVGGDLIVHRSPAGAVLGADYASDADLSQVSPARAQVSPGTAGLVARRSAGLRRVERQTPPVMAVYAVEETPRLVWETVLTGHGEHGPQRDVAYVDARTGQVVNTWSLTHRAEGTGRSLYSGTVPVDTVLASGRFRMRDESRGGSRTYDAGDRSLGSQELGTLFTDADNRWGDGTTSSRQSAAVDAHYGVAETWDYFESRFHRRGIRNDGAGVVARVHYGKPGSPGAQNAFWDDRCACVTFGRGGDSLRPMVAMDVVAHEMAHGVTSSTAGLLYFGESGGLNEANSDIFGAMVEFSARNTQDPGDYLVGEEVLKVRPGFLRRMDRPAADGWSYNCWTPTMGRDDVHFSSGPGNHFFYLLAEGTGVKTIGGRRHSSPTCNGSGFGGIGKAAAGKVWYHALTRYMTSTTDYADARDATVRAARDLFGDGSTQCRAVARAWAAVAVAAQNEVCGGPQPASGPNAVANGGFEAGDNNAWTALSDASDPAPMITRDRSYGIPHSGQWWAVLNGDGAPVQEELRQVITVPTGSQVTLRFHLLVSTFEPLGAGARDVLRVRVVAGDGSTRLLGTYSNAQASDSYTQRDLDLSPYAGQTVRLRFVGKENANPDPTWFLLDDVSVTAG
ncbi:MAG: M4 family metallopeptidase [Actinomycetota bacterium]|nr:M4 family metallopeptidase [Actinomycetota bacterium]